MHPMILTIAVITTVKLLLLPAYTSTDFEVHRNWLAITHSLPLSQWYYDTTSQWTLDYPPAFAYFEYILSQFGVMVDKRMVDVHAIEYHATTVVYFQRLTVIATDILLYYAVHLYASTKPTWFNATPGKSPHGSKTEQQSAQSTTTTCMLIYLCGANTVLILIDNIHFQYNGLLLAILIMSLHCINTQQHIAAAVLYTVLLCFKHIFLYVAPVYFIYLLRHCMSFNNKHIDITKSLVNLAVLGTTVLSTFAAICWPFAAHYKQLLARLFPFQRGLSHAYWAPNIWALYNAADRALVALRRMSGYVGDDASIPSTTSGLVQVIDHIVLPTITPSMTATLTLACMVPALVKLWRSPTPDVFTACILYCTMCSFMCGWHVHEKAILLVIVPLSLLALDTVTDARHFVFCSIIGTVSVFPLMIRSTETPIKWLLALVYHIVAYVLLLNWHSRQQVARRIQFISSILVWYEAYYLWLIVPVHLLASVILPYRYAKLEFAPLMLKSVYCSIAMCYTWYRLYRNIDHKISMSNT